MDFSTKEGKELFRAGVERRVGYGMERDKAEMLTAALMTNPPLINCTVHGLVHYPCACYDRRAD